MLFESILFILLLYFYYEMILSLNDHLRIFVEITGSLMAIGAFIFGVAYLYFGMTVSYFIRELIIAGF